MGRNRLSFARNCSSFASNFQPLRTGDVQDGITEVRIPEQAQRLAHPIEAELHPEVGADEKGLLDLLERHPRTTRRRAARMLRVPAAALASSSRPNAAR